MFLHPYLPTYPSPLLRFMLLLPCSLRDAGPGRVGWPLVVQGGPFLSPPPKMIPTIERYGSKAIRYLSIYNKQTEHYETHIDNDIPSIKYDQYKVPTGYTVYIRMWRLHRKKEGRHWLHFLPCSDTENMAWLYFDVLFVFRLQDIYP